MQGKRKQGEDPLAHLDARDLLGRFRSKKDLYTYLDEHRNQKFYFQFRLLVQLYLPSIDRMNKDFLRDVFCGKKHLIPRD